MSVSGSTWLVVGHGSVGSFVVTRLASRGATVFVLDPSPRVPVTAGRLIQRPRDAGDPPANIVSCVAPASAEDVPGMVGKCMTTESLYLDWNTIAPARKREIDRLTGGRLVDVALLDSLDVDVERPLLAVSGPCAARAAAALRQHAFDVRLVGPEVGAAAKLKYLRSTFMKGLEALVLEHAALARANDPQQIVRESLQHNLGSPFSLFADALIASNQLHAKRRAAELQDAVTEFTSDGGYPHLASAAIDVLRQAADAWAHPSAPAPGSDLGTLVNYLRDTLCQPNLAST